ncbi:hypothetical protein E4T66_14580 [Sinimarinibacterium sp. CAU 1509]|uniref:hypothetical protein n=1 Tax=Sinimarinibacterium sp. CAU 1509 TaxID=2562283 RepID=UPI0010AC95F1|nr:hypothetical protein [Sinimarinibacterium sp. CAU 1509]TJY58824.1 hypothetical protein E4T66_14580 [Sinimarinibacterium sp. CAU 1509]
MRLTLFVALAAVLLGGLWWWLRPAAEPAAAIVPPAAVIEAPTAATVTPSGARRFVLEVPAPGHHAAAQTLQATQGDRIELTVTSPHDDELHLHGYDLSLALRANTPGSLLFEADHAGRFEIELHHSHVELGAFEILPR